MKRSTVEYAPEHLKRRVLLMIGYATAVSDWTREQAAKQLAMSEADLDAVVERARGIEYYDDGIVIPPLRDV